MSFVWNRENLTNALKLDPGFDLTAGKLEFNSQAIKENDIFIALEGGARDGHEFVESAFSNGAALAICSKKMDFPRVIKVEDTFKALQDLAKFKRENIKAKYIGITGSVGKTSTKEFLKNIFSSFGNTHANFSNFNNYLGVPLTLASIPEDTEFVINEMGMNNAGEIRELTKFVKPNIAIITRIAEAHIEFLKSIENICKAKCEIFESMDKDGVAIINSTSPCYDLQKEILNNLGIKNILSFGDNLEDYCKVEILNIYESNMDVVYNIDGKKYPVNLKMRGVHNAFNIASVMLAVHAAGEDLQNAAYSLERITNFSGRGDIHKVNMKGSEVVIIDDAYNANPASVSAALDSLSHYKKDKTAILADMGELGENAILLHKNLADKVRSANISTLVTFGPLMKNLHDEVKNEINAIHYEEANSDSFSELTDKLENKEQVILVKGSKYTMVRSFVDFVVNKFGD